MEPTQIECYRWSTTATGDDLEVNDGNFKDVVVAMNKDHRPCMTMEECVPVRRRECFSREYKDKSGFRIRVDAQHCFRPLP